MRLVVDSNVGEIAEMKVEGMEDAIMEVTREVAESIRLDALTLVPKKTGALAASIIVGKHQTFVEGQKSGHTVVVDQDWPYYGYFLERGFRPGRKRTGAHHAKRRGFLNPADIKDKRRTLLPGEYIYPFLAPAAWQNAFKYGAKMTWSVRRLFAR